MPLFEKAFITLHGPDGVGKTTAGRKLVELLAEHGHTAVFFDDWRDENGWKNPFSSKELRRAVGETDKGFVALQAAKAAVDSMVITELTDSGLIVIKDRGILDVRADLQHRGFDPADCAGPLIREPDFAVLLTVSEEGRMRRLANKPDVQPEDYQPNTPGHRLYDMTQSLQQQVEARMPDGGMIVNTDDISLREAIAVIGERILETV